jgi:hypothetical protein
MNISIGNVTVVNDYPIDFVHITFIYCTQWLFFYLFIRFYFFASRNYQNAKLRKKNKQSNWNLLYFLVPEFSHIRGKKKPTKIGHCANQSLKTELLYCNCFNSITFILQISRFQTISSPVLNVNFQEHFVFFRQF